MVLFFSCFLFFEGLFCVPRDEELECEMIGSWGMVV